MTQEDIIQSALKDSNYHLSLFSENELAALREKIIIKESKGKKTPFVTCIIRDKDIHMAIHPAISAAPIMRRLRQQ